MYTCCTIKHSAVYLWSETLETLRGPLEAAHRTPTISYLGPFRTAFTAVTHLMISRADRQRITLLRIPSKPQDYGKPIQAFGIHWVYDGCGYEMIRKRNLLITFDALGTIYRPRRPIAVQYGEVAADLGFPPVAEMHLHRSFRIGGRMSRHRREYSVQWPDLSSMIRSL